MSKQNDQSYRDFAEAAAGVYPEETYSGLLVETWPNGTLKFRGEFERNRRRVGPHVCFWENGTPKEVSFWIGGWLVGTVCRFREDGSRELERSYGDDGSKTRSWIETRYGLDNRIVARETYVNGELTEKWLDPLIAEALASIDED